MVVTRSKHTAARPCTIHGIRFASEAEGRYYLGLVARQRTGEIASFECHPHFPLIVNGRKCGRGYTADFLVTERDGSQTVVEVKGRVMRDFPLRRDLFRALYSGQYEYLIIEA